MLVLSRYAGETVYVGTEIQVKVLSVWRSEVRLGITAPRITSVDRKEVRQRKQRAKGSQSP